MKRYSKQEVVDALLKEAQRVEGRLEMFTQARSELEEFYDADGESIELTDEALEKESEWIKTLREVAFNIQYGNILN